MADNVENTVQQAKDAVPPVTPTPPEFDQQVSAFNLKSRLQWGEPGLTVIDVRDRESFNNHRIMGAIAMPMDTITERAQSLEANRDIYVYGSTDEETAQAANTLREAGYQKVAEIQGGMQAWEEIDGPTEGRDSINDSPDESEYNVVSRLQEHAKVRDNEEKQVASQS
jgi:rhodanese-related sulfurtransferase